MPLLGMEGAVEGQEELSLRSDELSSWGRVPVGKGCSWNCDLRGGQGGEMSGWILTVEVVQG